MKTPSQRKKGKAKKKRFKTQLEVDIDNGFDASRYEQPTAANYRTVKNAMDKQRNKLGKALEERRKKRRKKAAYFIAKEKCIKEQARKKMKTQTVFDVIDNDD